MTDGLPLLGREDRDRFLVLLMTWFGLKRFVRLVPREQWEEALRAVSGDSGRRNGSPGRRAPRRNRTDAKRLDRRG